LILKSGFAAKNDLILKRMDSFPALTKDETIFVECGIKA